MKQFLLFFSFNILLQICFINALPLTNINNNSSLKRDTSPKFRVLIMVAKEGITETHYVLHRHLAELLAADKENVEQVLLLVHELDCAEPTEVPPKFDGRLLVWHRMTFDWAGAKNCTDAVLQHRQREREHRHIWEDFMLFQRELIEQLKQFDFNVGVGEVGTGDLSISGLREFPTIKKYVGTQSTSPPISQWKYLGYDRIVGAMPGRDVALIGDHEFATESAIKKNPDYFRERNEALYIKAIEQSEKILEALFLRALNRSLLSRNVYGELITHERFSSWDIEHRMDLYFTNVQPFLDFPVVEQEIERERHMHIENRVTFIGGVTMPKGVVPKMNGDTKQIFESANSENENGGVVLLSFGSVVEMNEGEAHAVAVKNIVVEVFKQYPQMNMIIKWGKRAPIGTGEQYKKLADNVYAKSWLEQSAILDGGLKLFITHGGQNSINEAVKSGVPLILFPFFGDQFNNAEALAARGVAKVIDIRSKTLKNDFADAFNEMLTNYAECKQKMDELSTKMNAVEPEKEFIEKFGQLRKSL
ncbi:hypothetical protein niasHS_013707 [Heterodera schachtii]|uniref:UDP-glucuronosyltransferase n=1 Tax=Heterodera schachtii TaxID=97005 RepID=A0ABD2IWD0_HETSC